MPSEDPLETPNGGPAARARVWGKHRRTPGLAIATGIAIVIVYLAAHLLMPRDGFWINDNECKFIQLAGLLQTGYRDFSVPWPGLALDPDLAYNPLVDPFGYVVDGELYCFSPPAFAAVSTLPYRLWGKPALTIIPLLAGMMTLLGVSVLTKELSATRNAQAIAMVLVGLGTPLWFYSMTLWEHALAVCLMTWSVATFMQYVSRGGLGRVAVSAVLCGLAIYFRDDLAVFGAVFPVAALICTRTNRWRGAALFAAVLIVSVLPLLWFQWRMLGHPLGHHGIHHSPLEFGVLRYLFERWSVVRSLLIDGHRKLLLSIAISGPALILWGMHPQLPRRVFRWFVPLAAGVAAVGTVVAMLGHVTARSPLWWLVSANGLFAASPFLALAFIRIGAEPAEAGATDAIGQESRRQRVLWIVLTLYVASYVVLIPRLHSTGVHWGCRLLLVAYPIMGALAASTLARWWEESRGPSRAWVAVPIIAVLLGVGAQVHSLRLLHARKTYSARVNRIVAGRPERVVVTNHGLVPQYLSQCFYDKTIFMLHRPGDWRSLRDRLRRAGTREILFVTAWRPKRDEPAPEGEVLRDGALRYIAVEYRPIALSGSSSLRGGSRRATRAGRSRTQARPGAEPGSRVR